MRRTVAILVYCFFALILAACGSAAAPPSPSASSKAAPPASSASGSPASSPQPPSGSQASGSAKPSALQDAYQAAKKEGEVVWQMDRNPDLFKNSVAAFKKSFPDIKLTYINVATTEAPPRIVTEAQAKRLTIDVMTSSLNRVGPLVDRGLVVPVDFSSTGIDPKKVLLNGQMLFQNDSMFPVTYNKNLVAPKDVPTKYEDFLDPKWQGKIVVHRAGSGWQGLSLAWDTAKLKQYWEALSKQKLMVAANGTDALREVSTGEAALTNGTPLDMVATAVSKGAPVDLAPVSPMHNVPEGMMLVKNGPHPNAGKLLMLWLASPEGQQALAKDGWGQPITACGPSPEGKLLCGKNIQIALMDSFDKVNRANAGVQLAVKTLGLAQ